MYFNPFSSELKDERLELIEQYSIDNIEYLTFFLHSNSNTICPRCKRNNVIKFGKKLRTLKTKILMNSNTVVNIKYHRFKCKDCNKIFDDKCADVEVKNQIPYSTIHGVLNHLKLDISMKNIAVMFNLSETTIQRIFDENINCPAVSFGDVLCVDEFKNLKDDNENKYAFIMYDPNRHEINDILPNRHIGTISDYLYKKDYKELEKVKYFISDMYETYRSIKKKFFPNSTHIVDSFHYIRYVTDAFDSVRIRIQKEHDEKTWQYKILKRYSKILLKNVKDIGTKPIHYNPKTHRHETSSSIITTALEISSELSEAYALLQDFLTKWNKTKFENANEFIGSTIHDFQYSSLKEFRDASHTFINWKKEIINSFIRFGNNRLNNEYIEGMNNRIKEIKRVGFGYRNFEHFRNRIMYIVNRTIRINKKLK